MPDTTIARVEWTPVDLALREPFGIATGVQHRAENVFVRVTLASGVEGWGEAAPFHDVNGETRAMVLDALATVSNGLVGRDAAGWVTFGDELATRIPRSASARCALETAVVDAVASHFEIPLWVMLGGATSSLETDLTITTGTVDAARVAADRIAREGYRTIKLKVGGVGIESDLARLDAVIAAAPSCALLLDGNAALESPEHAVRLVEHATRAGARVVLLEQPLARGDHAGARAIHERCGVRVAADESACSVDDVRALIEHRGAQVVNLKIMKSGVIEAMRMAFVARAHGLGLMIGGMVESGVAMSMSASMAAGLGGFEFVDLDTPLWLLESPIESGYAQHGPKLELRGIRAGHGARPRPGAIDIGGGAR